MPRSLTRILPLLVLAILTMVGAGLVPLATAPEEVINGADSTFVVYMEPRLLVLLDSARTVESMVSERSRNMLALRAESERINATAESIDAFLDDRELTSEEQAVAYHYRKGSAYIGRAIDAAYDAIREFDFSALPAMIPVFGEGVSEIEKALATLRTEHKTTSSYTDISVA